MGELAMHLFDHASRGLEAAPFAPSEAAEIGAPPPRPMVRGNHASAHDACFVGPLFKERCVVSSSGWEWRNEAKGPRPKWGYIADEARARRRHTRALLAARACFSSWGAATCWAMPASPRAAVRLHGACSLENPHPRLAHPSPLPTHSPARS